MTQDMTVLDLVWNRAALDEGGADPHEGDVALAKLLAVHGMVMNGGVEHALEVLDADQYAAGIAGYRYFGFAEVADLLERARSADELDWPQLDDSYGQFIPDDGRLVRAFEAQFAASPTSFSPLRRSGHA